jgi:hypothetical protein
MRENRQDLVITDPRVEVDRVPAVLLSPISFKLRRVSRDLDVNLVVDRGPISLLVVPGLILSRFLHVLRGQRFPGLAVDLLVVEHPHGPNVTATVRLSIGSPNIEIGKLKKNSKKK